MGWINTISEEKKTMTLYIKFSWFGSCLRLLHCESRVVLRSKLIEIIAVGRVDLDASIPGT